MGTAITTRQRIADAAITVIGRDGFDVVSVRTVAMAVGLAAGTVQHHFPSRDQLLVGAYERMVERIIARIGVDAAKGSYAAALRHALIEMQPLDAVRREETSVWLALSAAAPSRPGLLETHRHAVDFFRQMIRALLDEADRHGQLRDGIDPRLEAVRVPALSDGLALHAISAPAEDMERIMATIDALLRGLFTEEALSSARSRDTGLTAPEPG